jgi:hypothetical protein
LLINLPKLPTRLQSLQPAQEKEVVPVV